MSSIYLKYGAIVSPLGTGIKNHFSALENNKSAVTKIENSGFNKEDWYLGKIEGLSENRYTDILKNAIVDFKNNIPKFSFNERVGIIVSTTKADLSSFPEDTFQSTRNILEEELGTKNDPIFISNACISGLVAINTASDYIQAGVFDDVIVIGIDALSDFVVYGFQSLFAMSDIRTTPYDASRKGISIGEACGIILVSNKQPTQFGVEYLGGASSNDANHISGPSRTGEGLVRAVNETFKRSKINSSSIDYISAHGTGTIYNDEMESIAFNRLEIDKVPVNSYKGYFGHTLGAAGIIEILVSMISLENSRLFKSLGYSTQGTSIPLAIIEENKSATIKTVLKTASGFGGGNAALAFKAIEV